MFDENTSVRLSAISMSESRLRTTGPSGPAEDRRRVPQHLVHRLGFGDARHRLVDIAFGVCHSDSVAPTPDSINARGTGFSGRWSERSGQWTEDAVALADLADLPPVVILDDKKDLEVRRVFVKTGHRLPPRRVVG